MSKPVIVFDNGSGYLKAGLSNKEVPMFTLPALIGRPMLRHKQKIENIEYCIPSHGDCISKNLTETIEMNRLAILETKEMLLNLISKGRKTSEELLKAVADMNDMKLGFGNFVLVGSTLRSYLAILHDLKYIKVVIEDNKFYWTL